jgi:hypothetical protein
MSTVATYSFQIALATGHRMTVEGPFDGEAVGRLLRVLTLP